jgi:hypothetical protein
MDTQQEQVQPVSHQLNFVMLTSSEMAHSMLLMPYVLLILPTVSMVSSIMVTQLVQMLPVSQIQLNVDLDSSQMESCQEKVPLVSVIPVPVFLDSSVMVSLQEMKLYVFQALPIAPVLSSTMVQESNVLTQYQIALQASLTVDMETNVFLQPMIAK